MKLENITLYCIGIPALVAATLGIINKVNADTNQAAMLLNSTSWASSTVDVTNGEDIYVPTFDAHLGTLDHITVKFGRYVGTYTIRAENTSTSSGCSQNMWSTTFATANLAGYGNLCWFSNGDSANPSLGVYDNVTDFAGTSGFTQENSYDYFNAGVRNISDAGLLSDITDDGISTFTVHISQSTTGDSTGTCSNSISNFASDTKATFRITYWYN